MNEEWVKATLKGEVQDGDYYHIDAIKHVAYIVVLGAFAIGLLAGWWFL